MSEIVIRKIDLNSSERKIVEDFLLRFDLSLEKDVENTIIAEVGEKLVGTCSNSKDTLKCFAVDENYRGEGITSKLITFITNVLFDKGIYETFIFTKPNNICAFRDLGYKDVYSTKEVVLLEGGMSKVEKYVENMFKISNLSNKKKAAIVMNCNPYTLGHRHLIEKAAKENDEVVIFIVQEDKSLFPFEIRLDLVKKGTADLKNVNVVPGGKYIISSSTFPTYFLKSENEKLMGYANLDAGIFGKYIAPIFNINKRYIGTEPYCQVTSKYNEALLDILPKHGVSVDLVKRLEMNNIAISASQIRNNIKLGNIKELEKLLPKVTYDFLTSKEAEEIIAKIQRSDCRH